MAATKVLPATEGRNGQQVSNGGAAVVDLSRPYIARVSVLGVAPLLFHAWNCESIAEKSNAAKGSKGKKTDDVESYVYRTTDGAIGVPGKNLHGALIEVARYYQDPRSPRKALRDMVRAAIIPLTVVAPFEPHTKKWDYEDHQRVTVQRAGITRVRPAMKEGWRLTFDLMVTLPEYIGQELLAKLVTDAGRLAGLCDYRPTYGRFALAGLTVRGD